MNCLANALNAWHTDGGYIVLRKSAARSTPHVLHIGDEGLQHYSPGAPLGHPVQALIGFDGVVWDREMADAPPVRMRAAAAVPVALAVAFFGKPERVRTPAPAAAAAIGLFSAKLARIVPIAAVPISSTAVAPA